jgi:myo-inositol-1-phosphate synthase
MKPKIGVMIVGMSGATANTAIVGAIAGSEKEKTLGSIISTQEFKDINFISDRQIVFGGWDIVNKNAYAAALDYEIIPESIVKKQRRKLTNLYPLPGISTNYDVSETKSSDHCIQTDNLKSAIDKIKNDIDDFRARERIKTCIVVYLGPPLKQVDRDFSQVHKDDLEKMILDNSSYITSAMIYAIGSIKSNCGFIDFTPNITLEVPGIIELAEEYKVPVAGRDGNTGQSLMKTVIGDMFRIRNFKLEGWYSTNILGNNDGLVLSRSEHRKLKMQDKLGVIDPIVGYNDFEHVVDISYYMPRGDNKESWDNIDFLGWLGLSICMKINWIGRDSILAAPLVLDLIKHLYHSISNEQSGIQEHLAMYFKHPLACGVLPFTQAYEKLKTHYGICSDEEER